MKNIVVCLVILLGLLHFGATAKASKIECVESLKKRSSKISFYSPGAAAYLDLYDPLEGVVYVFPKVAGQVDYSFFLVTEDKVYRVDHKPSTQSGAFHSNPKARPRFFAAQDSNGKVISLFQSVVEGPLDKTFSIKPLRIEAMSELKESEFAKVKAQLLSNPSDIKAAEDSFIISFWKAWEASTPSDGGIRKLLGNTDEGWNDVKEACGPYFSDVENVEMDTSCHPSDICGTISKKIASSKEDESEEEADSEISEESEN